MFLVLPGCREEQAPVGGPPAAVSGPRQVELLNVANDPTRELWRDLNAAFAVAYQAETGNTISIKQSHASSGSQARAVLDGLEADVVALAVWPDTDQLRKKGLLSDGWEDRLPNRSLPYTTPIVFVVRKGNPKGIKAWKDLIQPDIEIITPNPKTSGNGKIAFLAAWGSVIVGEGTQEEAREFVSQIYKRVPVLDTGARGSTMSFARKGMGDVHLAFESEAHLEVEEAKGNLEIVWPGLSLLAEPHVAVVDAIVDKRKTRAAAEAYLKFLYTDDGQEIIAKHFYRPMKAEVVERYRDRFPKMTLFSITTIGPDWDEIQARFFADGALFDQIYKEK